MANNRVYIRCDCGKGGACLGKYYPSTGWFVGLPTPRGLSENGKTSISDEMRCKEFVERIEEFFTEHSHDKDTNFGNTSFFLEFEEKKKS